MTIRTRTETLDTVIARLVDDAMKRAHAPLVDAEYTAKATKRALFDMQGYLTQGQVVRVERYFASVLRRRAGRRGADVVFSARYLVASIIADLRSAGRNDFEILTALEEGWASRVPTVVMDEYRHLLTPAISA